MEDGGGCEQNGGDAPRTVERSRPRADSERDVAGLPVVGLREGHRGIRIAGIVDNTGQLRNGLEAYKLDLYLSHPDPVLEVSLCESTDTLWGTAFDAIDARASPPAN